MSTEVNTQWIPGGLLNAYDFTFLSKYCAQYTFGGMYHHENQSPAATSVDPATNEGD